MVRVIMQLAAATAPPPHPVQEHLLCEGPEDEQPGNSRLLSPGLIRRHQVEDVGGKNP